jgi:hypothetical protein
MKHLPTFALCVISQGLLLTTLLLFAQCGDDDDSGPALTYTIDGQSQPVQTVTGVLMSEIQYDREGRSLNITAAQGFDQLLSVAVSNWDFQNPPDNGILTGEYDATLDEDNTEDNPLAECLPLTDENEGIYLCAVGLISMVSGQDLYFSVFDGDTGATIVITSCDPGKRTVSGTFQGKIGTIDGETIKTISGSFTNVKYTVQ